jgi:hypothetical protein
VFENFLWLLPMTILMFAVQLLFALLVVWQLRKHTQVWYGLPKKTSVVELAEIFAKEIGLGVKIVHHRAAPPAQAFPGRFELTSSALQRGDLGAVVNLTYAAHAALRPRYLWNMSYSVIFLFPASILTLIFGFAWGGPWVLISTLLALICLIVSQICYYADADVVVLTSDWLKHEVKFLPGQEKLALELVEVERSLVFLYPVTVFRGFVRFFMP